MNVFLEGSTIDFFHVPFSVFESPSGLQYYIFNKSDNENTSNPTSVEKQSPSDEPGDNLPF